MGTEDHTRGYLQRLRSDFECVVLRTLLATKLVYLLQISNHHMRLVLENLRRNRHKINGTLRFSSDSVAGVAAYLEVCRTSVRDVREESTIHIQNVGEKMTITDRLR